MGRNIPIYSMTGIIGEMEEENDTPMIKDSKKSKSKNTDNNDTITNKKKKKETLSNRKPHGRKPPIEDLGVKPPTKDKSTYSIYDDHVDTDING